AAQDGLAAQLDGKQLRPRIETDDQLAALATYRVRKPVGEDCRRDRGPGFHPRTGYRAVRPGARPDARPRPSKTALRRPGCVLEAGAGRKLRDGRGRDRHLLAGRPWVDALAFSTPGRREFAESREGHRLALLEGVGDRVEEGVDRARRIAATHLRLI